MEKFPGRSSGKIESEAEKIPSREEILSVLSKFAETEAIPVKERVDGKGVYLLEIEVPGKAVGETTLYCYMRKGEHGGSNNSEETKINVVYLEDGVPVGGESLARLNEETGEWE